MSTELAKKEENLPVKKESQVARALTQQEATLGQEVAMKALNLVKPMIKSVADELSAMLGDNEKIIVIRKTGATSQVSILILTNEEDYTIQSKKANAESSRIFKDNYLRNLRKEGKISDEDWIKMNTKDGKFLFKGEASPENPKRPKAIHKFYIAEEFVDMLLTGRMTDMTKKLME